MYRITFKAQAAPGRSVSSYIGKASDPWNAYSGYNGITIGTTEENYGYSFSMSDQTDLQARLVFDLGKMASDISISEINIELISFEPSPITALQKNNYHKKILFFPNPVSKILYIPDLPKYQVIEIHDLNGKSINGFHVNKAASTIYMDDLPAGIYIVKLSGHGLEDHLKVLKN